MIAVFTFDGRSLGVGKWGILFGWHFFIWSLKGSGGSAMAEMHGKECEESRQHVIRCPFSDATIHQIQHLYILFDTGTTCMIHLEISLLGSFC